MCGNAHISRSRCIIAALRLLQRHKWLAYVGLAVTVYVALEMIYQGGAEVLPEL
jgi:predicted tellurium resistance membrane protein TerC